MLLLLNLSFSNSTLPSIHKPPSKPLIPIHSDKVDDMDASQVQNWMHYLRPDSGTSQTFEDVSLSLRLSQDHSSDTSGGFSHTPLEHEVVASRSVWDDSRISDELIEQHMEISTTLSGQSFPAARARSSSKYSVSAVGGQAHFASEALRDLGLDEAVTRSAVLESRSDVADLSTPGTASDVTLVEEISALDTASEPTDTVDKLSLSADFPIDRNAGPLISEKDISDQLNKSSEHVNSSNGPAELTISISPARLIAHAHIPRAERSEFFEIPIPRFPFPAGTSRCKNRNCPIKIRHEQGPYLHEGKLRTREGSIFGSSNPPPEIWFLYDMSGKERFQTDGGKALAPVELFVKYHFGETRGERVLESNEAGGNVQEGAKWGGKRKADVVVQ